MHATKRTSRRAQAVQSSAEMLLVVVTVAVAAAAAALVAIYASAAPRTLRGYVMTGDVVAAPDRDVMAYARAAAASYATAAAPPFSETWTVVRGADWVAVTDAGAAEMRRLMRPRMAVAH